MSPPSCKKSLQQRNGFVGKNSGCNRDAMIERAHVEHLHAGAGARQPREALGGRLAAAVELIHRRGGVGGEGVEIRPARGQRGQDRLGEILAQWVNRNGPIPLDREAGD